MVSRSERRRRLARERWERQQARRTAELERGRRHRRVVAVVAVAAVAVAVVAAAVVWWTGGDEDLEAITQSTPEPSVATAGSCAWTETGSPAVEGVAAPPKEPVDPALPWTATLTLSGRDVSVDLLADEAPCTVTSLNHLAQAGYFAGTECHRLTASPTLSVLQCGDPTGTGSGGPGYQFAEENTEGATYPAGTLAMANAGPGTNGSQFFLVYEDSELPPNYTVFGQVTGGLEVLTDLAAQGTADGSPDGAPAETVTLDDLVVTGV